MKDIPERRIEPVEVMLVLGNAAAVRTALFAAHLYEHGMAPLIVCCGGRGRTTLDKIETEAATMAMVLRSCGIPEQAILTDQSSSNTKENFVNGFALLKRHGINPRSIAIVHDSGTPRRDRNMLWRHFPEYQPSSGAKLAIHPSWGETFLEVALCGSFGSSFEPYAHMFVGTIQRVLECACPARPWHVPDEPPTDVREAYLRLRDRFTQQLEPIPNTQGPKSPKT